MALTNEQYAALHTSLVARFNAGLVLGSDDWRKIVGKPLPSTGHSNTYAWKSLIPSLQEWPKATAIAHSKLAEKAYAVVNRKFGRPIDIPREDIDDDNFGHYGDIAEGYGIAVSDLMNTLVFGTLASGFSQNCFDDQYFFDTDHPVYPNEDGTGTPTLVSNRIAGGTGEPWALLCLKRGARPAYIQERDKAQLTAMIDPSNSQQVFDYDMYSYNCRWRGEGLFGFWQTAFGAKVALDDASFTEAYDKMMLFKRDGGQPMGVMPDTLVVGPSNRAAAEKIVLAANKSGGESNTNYKKVELIVSPWMV